MSSEKRAKAARARLCTCVEVGEVGGVGLRRKLWTAGSLKVTGTITELSDVNEWSPDQGRMMGGSDG